VCKCRPIGGKICRSSCSMSDTSYRHNAVVGFMPRSLKPMLVFAVTPSAPSTAVLLTGLRLQAFVACGCDVIAPTTTCLAGNFDVTQTTVKLSLLVFRGAMVAFWWLRCVANCFSGCGCGMPPCA